MRDEPIQWSLSTLRSLSVNCPTCGRPACVTNASNPARDHLLNLEALCQSCTRYVYVTMRLPLGYSLNPRQSKRRKRCGPSSPIASVPSRSSATP